MAVQKFPTFEDVRRALWMTPGDPLTFERMRRLGELARPRPVRRGVFRYRTIEEAKAEKRVGRQDCKPDVSATWPQP